MTDQQINEMIAASRSYRAKADEAWEYFLTCSERALKSDNPVEEAAAVRWKEIAEGLEKMAQRVHLKAQGAEPMMG